MKYSRSEVDDEAEREHKTDQRRDADQLRGKLAGVSVEQTRYRTGHSVPAATVVAGAVCEETDGKHAPQAACTVDRDSADWIIHLQHVLDERNADANQHAGDEADDAGSWVR